MGLAFPLAPRTTRCLPEATSLEIGPWEVIGGRASGFEHAQALPRPGDHDAASDDADLGRDWLDDGGAGKIPNGLLAAPGVRAMAGRSFPV